MTGRLITAQAAESAEQGKPCPQHDDMPDLLQRMIDADVIVLATPVYFYTMNAQMKTLIDRTCSRYTEIRNKEFYFIVTAADTDVSAMQRTIEGFRGFTSCLPGAGRKGDHLWCRRPENRRDRTDHSHG